MTCSTCGAENPEGQRFCGTCGARLEEPASPGTQEVRKTITVVFSDVTGSTALGERLDPEALRRVMTRYFEAWRAIIERHGGIVEKFIGDAVMAVFGVPTVHEDDALRATRAAAEMREALADLNKELERDHGVTITNRTGVNTGEVVAGAGDQTIATGDTVNTAARLEQGAPPGEILLGEATYRLVRDAVVSEPAEPLAAKGKAEPLAAHRLLAVHPNVAQGIARRRDAPIVGRDRELRSMTEAFNRAIADRACILFTVLGAPGVGKSRLVEEFLGGIEATTLRGRCLPYGEGITYWPVVEMLTQTAGISDLDDADAIRAKLRALTSPADAEGDVIAGRLAQLLGVGATPAAVEETFWAFRRLLESLARTRPVIVDIDDVQWAEPTLFDLLEYVRGWARDVPILLLCSARPDLLDLRPQWSIADGSTITLEPLSLEDGERLVGELLEGVPPEIADRIARTAEGIPLFVEHLVASLVENGILARDDGDAWILRGELESLSLPPTVSALIAARLERLPSEELAVLERASIEGQSFQRGSVLALMPESERPRASERLMSLVRRDMIEPAESMFVGDDAFTFRHLLIRDAAYARISKETRADLHERYADWLADRTADLESELDEFIGYHLEQASLLRKGISPGDPRTTEVAIRAGERLGVVGSRALDRGDFHAAGALLARADALMPADARGRAPILLDLGVVHDHQGRTDEAIEVLAIAEELGRSSGDIGIAGRAIARRQLARSHVEDASQAALEAEAEPLVAELEGKDEGALAEILFFIGLSRFWRGHLLEAAEVLERASDLASRSGDARIAPDAVTWSLVVLWSGPTSAEETHARWLDQVANVPMSRHARAFGDTMDSASLAMMGDVEAARAQFREANSIIAELGDEIHANATFMPGAYIELLAGDGAAAGEMMSRAETELERLGERGYRSSVQIYLADAQHLEGALDEAIATTERTEAIAFPDDYEANSGWRAARARALADLGRHEDAERFAREALDHAGPTDALEMQLRAWASLGYVLACAGRWDEALGAYAESLERCERKGIVAAVARVRRTIAGLRGGSLDPDDPYGPGPWGMTWPLRRDAPG